MVTKVGINGFGRIGRLVYPHLLFTPNSYDFYQTY